MKTIPFLLLFAALSAQAAILPKPFTERFHDAIQAPRSPAEEPASVEMAQEMMDGLDYLLMIASNGAEAVRKMSTIRLSRAFLKGMKKMKSDMDTLFTVLIVTLAEDLTDERWIAYVKQHAVPKIQELEKAFDAWETAIDAYEKKLR